MNRRLSTFMKSSPKEKEKQTDEDSGSNQESNGSTTVAREEPLPIPSLKVKRLDYYYSRWTKGWKYGYDARYITVETIPIINTGANDAWKEYSFVIVRTIPKEPDHEPSFKIVIKSEYILKACKDIIETWPGISWNSDPVQLKPEVFITFYEQFKAYRDTLASKKTLKEDESYLLPSIDLLLSTLASDFKNTLSRIERLTSHKEISFDLIYAILVPRTLFVAECAITHLPRLFNLISWKSIMHPHFPNTVVCYELTCESIDLIDKEDTQTVVVGKVQTYIRIMTFDGTIKIDELDAYPLRFHKDEKKVREDLLERGRKWKGMIGIHHKEYDAIAAMKVGPKNDIVRHHVKGRIMVDRATFRKQNPNYSVPTPSPPRQINDSPDPMLQDQSWPPTNIPSSVGNGASSRQRLDALRARQRSHKSRESKLTNPALSDAVVSRTGPKDDTAETELSDTELLLAPTVVFGFSLADKVWLEFNVDKIQEVEWNKDAFTNLVLPIERKGLLQSLVEAHHQELGFDDFIKGKGHGLVVNLFGPPGVGKTLSAEATSEHVRRPLYVVGGGDLGTSAASLDMSLERVFTVATAWKAIILIDEADVFLEQRSLHELERNAMVAVFLRHVEYYRGILFLTTNRVRTFDEAFLSRIHVALHFTELTPESKSKVWKAFLAKVASAQVSDEQVAVLAKREVNGRQIKNAVRTAHSLAVARKEDMKFEHLVQTLDAMEEFNREFSGKSEGVMYV
ncbi:hypothetical protein BDQ17DRAFT_1284512 [Cyathus striatus]|nr:hypothetical protein BDQ17DRAFT_1284512 [Cyathus striatus]